MIYQKPHGRHGQIQKLTQYQTEHVQSETHSIPHLVMVFMGVRLLEQLADAVDVRQVQGHLV
jgi:hypothetical protein